MHLINYISIKWDINAVMKTYKTNIENKSTYQRYVKTQQSAQNVSNGKMRRWWWNDLTKIIKFVVELRAQQSKHFLIFRMQFSHDSRKKSFIARNSPCRECQEWRVIMFHHNHQQTWGAFQILSEIHLILNTFIWNTL